MPRVRFTARWGRRGEERAVREAVDLGQLPSDVVPFVVDSGDLRAVSEFLRRVDRHQTDPDRPIDLDVTVEARYGRRTLDQNALMWALYGFMALAMNAGQRGDHAVTKDELYEADMRDHADIYQVVCRERDLPDLRRFGWAWRRAVPVEGEDGKVRVDVVITSSRWDTLRMHQHLELLFRRLCGMDLDASTSSDVRAEWVRWREAIDADQVVLHQDGALTAQEYRERNPACEACGQPARELHHIRSRGAGGPDLASNYLHLCVADHRRWTAPGGGVRDFVLRYPHLRRKVEGALGRSVGIEGPSADQLLLDDGVPTEEVGDGGQA